MSPEKTDRIREKKIFITDVSLHKEVPVKFWKSLEFEVRMRA